MGGNKNHVSVLQDRLKSTQLSGRKRPADSGTITFGRLVHLRKILVKLAIIHVAIRCGVGGSRGLTAFKASITGFPDGGRQTALDRDASHEYVGDGAGLEFVQQFGVPESALSRLVYHHLSGNGAKLINDVVAILAAHQVAAHGALISNGNASIAAGVCLARHSDRRAIRQVGLKAHAGVEDWQTSRPASVQQPHDGANASLDGLEVCANAVGEAPLDQEIALHVDHEQGSVARGEAERKGFGVDGQVRGAGATGRHGCGGVGRNGARGCLLEGRGRERKRDGLRGCVIRGREAMKQVVGFSFLASPNQAFSAAHSRQLVPSAGRGLGMRLLRGWKQRPNAARQRAFSGQEKGWPPRVRKRDGRAEHLSVWVAEVFR